MIQLNLLPDVKLEYLKANRLRKTVISLSVFIAVISVGILILVLAAGAVQRTQISNADDKIQAKSSELKKKNQIDKVLTVQNQLNKLNTLHATKPAVASLFGYLNQVTPTTVSINDLHIDFTASTMTITGAADKLSSVNQFVDTLKYTTYTSDTVKEPTPAFTGVVLTSFGITNSSQGGQPATYTIDLTYAKDIFDITQKVKLNVPSKTTTRSSLDAPTNVFQTGTGN